jgi:hypothetical protein
MHAGTLATHEITCRHCTVRWGSAAAVNRCAAGCCASHELYARLPLGLLWRHHPLQRLQLMLQASAAYVCASTGLCTGHFIAWMPTAATVLSMWPVAGPGYAWRCPASTLQGHDASRHQLLTFCFMASKACTAAMQCLNKQ